MYTRVANYEIVWLFYCTYTCTFVQETKIFMVLGTSQQFICASHLALINPRLKPKIEITSPFFWHEQFTYFYCYLAQQINRFWFVFSLKIFISNKYKTILQHNNNNNNKYSVLHFDLYFWSHISLNASETEAYSWSNGKLNTFTVFPSQCSNYCISCEDQEEAWSCYCNSFSHCFRSTPFFWYKSFFRFCSCWDCFYWRRNQAICFCIYRYYYSVWEPWWVGPCSTGSGSSRHHGGTTKDSADNEDDDQKDNKQHSTFSFASMRASRTTKDFADDVTGNKDNSANNNNNKKNNRK